MDYIFHSTSMQLHLTLNGKFNIIEGDSGTGKSYLSRLAEEIRRDPILVKQQPLRIAGDDRLIEGWATRYKGALIIVDEGIDLEIWHKVVSQMKKSHNYYIICTREGNASIPYGIDTTFVLERTQKTLRMVPKYSGLHLSTNPRNFSTVITEDSGLGFKVAESKSSVPVIAAGSNSKLDITLRESFPRSLVLFDACGVGCYLNALLERASRDGHILYNSKSFEYEILDKVFSCCEDLDYFSECLNQPSEEAYYTRELQKVFQAFYNISYDKNSEELLNILLFGRGIVQRIFVDLTQYGAKYYKLYEFLESKQVSSVPIQHIGTKHMRLTDKRKEI